MKSKIAKFGSDGTNYAAKSTELNTIALKSHPAVNLDDSAHFFESLFEIVYVTR
jgi:hypothetical protein